MSLKLILIYLSVVLSCVVNSHPVEYEDTHQKSTNTSHGFQDFPLEFTKVVSEAGGIFNKLLEKMFANKKIVGMDSAWHSYWW